MRSLVIPIVAVGLSLVLSENARGQGVPPPCGNWGSVSTWNGTITITGTGQSSDQNGSYSTNESATITGHFTVGSNPSPSEQCDEGPQIAWVASPAQYSVTISNQTDTTCRDESGNRWPATVTYSVSRGTYSAAAAEVAMDFTDAANPRLSIGVAQAVDGLVTTFQPDPHCGTGGTVHTDGAAWGPTPLLDNLPLPSGPIPLSGSRTFQAQAAFTLGIATWTVTWNLMPNPRNLDLILSIPGYDTWRPAGGLTEKAAGADPVTGSSLLGISAQLVDKDTGDVINADKITFLLSGVSREPGVSMNWPAKGKATTDPDLSFDPAINPFVSVSENGTKAEATPQGGELTIAFLTPHDWGAWGTLKVTAESQGQTVDGHLESDTVTDILLPKRQAGSHIADGWKISHKLPLDVSDSDDAETAPEGLEGCVGDGLTLYEEYRGFMENKKHIEGDPAKKDFFIQNTMGGEGEAGIGLFRRLTGLTVHKDLKEDELDGVRPDRSLGDRIINFNHSQGAHQDFEQHAVVLGICSWFPNGKRINGAFTSLIKEGVRGRPGLAEFICIQPRDQPGSLASFNTHRGVISASDAVAQYDVGVAHELAHSVGVEHHGEGDPGPELAALLSPDDVGNPFHVPAFVLNGTPIRLLDEVTGADVAVGAWQKAAKTLRDNCQITSNYDPRFFSGICKSVFEAALSFNRLVLSIGIAHGQSSGDATCIMRYFFSNAYQSVFDSSTYFMVSAGTESPGRALCKSPAGTGINAPDHQPQPRFFDAANLRGACQTWVCVNDKYAPVPDKIP